MRILFTIRNLQLGGPEQALLKLCNWLQANGHDPLVAPYQPGGELESEFSARRFLSKRNMEEVPPHPKNRIWSSAKKQAAQVKSLAPDAWQSFVYTPLWTEGMVAALSGVPYAIRRADNLHVRHGEWMIRSRLAQRIVCLNNSMTEIHYGNEPKFTSRLRTIGNGVDTTCFCPNEGRRQQNRQTLGLGTEDFACVYVANLRDGKNHDFLLNVFQKFTATDTPIQPVLLLAGRDLLQGKIQKKIADLGLQNRVRHLGPVQDVSPLLNAADCFVFPSEVEGFSNALLEAMSSALPCIAIDQPWVREVIEDGKEGILLPLANLEAWGKSLLRLTPDKRLCRMFGEAARNKVITHFSLEAMGENYLQVYQEMVAAYSGRSAIKFRFQAFLEYLRWCLFPSKRFLG